MGRTNLAHHQVPPSIRAPHRAVLLGERINQPPTRIVTRACVLGAGIAQTDNELERWRGLGHATSGPRLLLVPLAAALSLAFLLLRLLLLATFCGGGCSPWRTGRPRRGRRCPNNRYRRGAFGRNGCCHFHFLHDARAVDRHHRWVGMRELWDGHALGQWQILKEQRV